MDTTAQTSSPTRNRTAGSGQPFVLDFKGYQRGQEEFRGTIGYAFEVEDPIEITHLGSWKLDGSAGHIVLFLVDPEDYSTIPGTTVEVELGGNENDSFCYAALPEPFRAEPGRRYLLLSERDGGEDDWYHEYTILRTTSAARSLGGVWKHPETGAWKTQHFADTGYGPLNFLYRSPAASAPREAIWEAVEAVPFEPRADFGRRLEPEGAVLHGAGQSPEAFAAYAVESGETPPAVYMAYTGVGGYGAERLLKIHQEYAHHPFKPVPQIGLGMTYDGQPERCYAHDVAAGVHDEAIGRIVDDLKAMDFPVYIRLGYEFNGSWNGYESTSFVEAWRRVASAIRDAGLDHVALLWCASGDGSFENFMDYYPGDEWVDWWSIDLFSANHFYDPGVAAFMDEALRHKFPVMIGESTPRYIGSVNGDASWQLWFQPYFNFIRKHPHLKGFSYINWDWEATKWPWGDGRIEANETVRQRFLEELQRPFYRHGGQG